MVRDLTGNVGGGGMRPRGWSSALLGHGCCSKVQCVAIGPSLRSGDGRSGPAVAVVKGGVSGQESASSGGHSVRVAPCRLAAQHPR